MFRRANDKEIPEPVNHPVLLGNVHPVGASSIARRGHFHVAPPRTVRRRTPASGATKIKWNVQEICETGNSDGGAFVLSRLRDADPRLRNR